MKKFNDEVSVGDVLLVHAEGNHQVTWHLGRIIEAIPCENKVIMRLMKLKTKSETL